MTIMSGVKTEEASRLTGATAITVLDQWVGAFPISQAVDLNWYSLGANDGTNTNGDGTKEMAWKLMAPHKFKAIALQNHLANGGAEKSWKDSKVLVGTDEAYMSALLTECVVSLNDNGVHILASACQSLSSDVIAFRRGPLAAPYLASFWHISLAEVRAYQCSLLPTCTGVSVTWSITHTTATETGSVDNLLSNFDVRSGNRDRKAMLDSSGSYASYDSCYRVICIHSNGCTDTDFGLTVDFNQPVFLHALLMVLDTLNTNTFDSWDIYCIAEDGTEHLCGTYVTSTTYGFEGWLNKQVVAIRIVAAPIDQTNWDVTICMLAPMGTSYVHDNIVPTSLSI